MIYEIFEGNMERLEKKLTAIRNKCEAYGCPFHYAITGETYREVERDGKTHMARFIQVDVAGLAVINNWEFVASVEHTKNGNIFSGTQGVEIPKMYYHSEPICEHCGTRRNRKNTYIVRNVETGEFKQVGKSCLRDFTHGMSAEAVAQYLGLFDDLVKGDAPGEGAWIVDYLDRDVFLSCAAEAIRHFGYVKSRDEENISTAIRAENYYDALRGNAPSCIYDEMEQIGFDEKRPETVRFVHDALDWIAGEPEYNDYIHNLKTVAGLDHVGYRHAALLVSLLPVYSRVRERMNVEDEYCSRYVGIVGKKFAVEIKSVRCMSSYETQWGTKRIYKFRDNDGNILIWRTGTLVDSIPEGAVLKGTVKAHSKFRGVEQTEVSHCRIEKKLDIPAW